MKNYTVILFCFFSTTFLSAQDLCGFWKSYEYPCLAGVEYFETFAISQNGSYVVSTKIAGDECVTSGQVSWEGTYSNSIFPVIAHLGNSSTPNCCYGISSVQVINEYHLIFDNTINLWKFSCDEVVDMKLNYSDFGLNCNCRVNTGSITISPNPVQNIAYLSNNSGEEINSIEIINNIGQRIFFHEGSIREINLVKITPGIYLYNITTAGGQQSSGKFCKM